MNPERTPSEGSNGSDGPDSTRTPARIIPIYHRESERMPGTPGEAPYSTSSASAQSTDTIRRLENIDTPIVPSSVESFDTAHERQTPEPSHVSRASSRSSLREPQKQSIVTPDRKAWKPSPARRTSSAAIPHKGQEFSVEDELDEVEEDQRARAIGSIGSTGYAGMRRKSQVLRRRGTAASVLREVENDGEDDTPEEGDGTDLTPTQDDAEIDRRTIRDAEDDDESDAGSDHSFTLKDRQQAINRTHPFGIRIWKPALYKKSRSVQRTAEGDIHSAPGGRVGPILFAVNLLWVVLFGWWMAALTAFSGVLCYTFFFRRHNRQYGNVLFGLAYYLFYPFGRFVELKQEEAYAEEDEGEGRSISEYEQWQAGDIEAGRSFFGPHTPRSIVGRRRDSMDTISETESLLGTGERTGLLTGLSTGSERKTRLFGRGQWSLGRVLFYACFYTVIAPMLLFVSGICWLLVFWIPMGKVTYLLFDHLRRHPLALSFHSDHTWSRRPGTPSSSILLCTYRAVGWKYYKYTVDGTNIFFINLLGVVALVIVDYFVFREVFHWDSYLTAPGMIFTMALGSVIPLAYFIGQAVASISAQSSMGMGATINAFFSTIVEVYLYCIALTEGKGRLVEGSIVGSIFAGVVLMPGMSMFSGALKRKTQKFNAKSAGVTSTMLLFSVIAAFAPTLFYQIHGTYELSCRSCVPGGDDAECRRCSFSQTPPTNKDHFFKQAVQPYTWISAGFLFLSYVVGLWFTLKTHAAIIWQSPMTTHAQAHVTTQAAPPVMRPSEREIYRRVLAQSLSSIGIRQDGQGGTVHRVPPRTSTENLQHTPGHRDYGTTQDPSTSPPNLGSEEHGHLLRGYAETAAAAAAAAVRDAHRQARQKTPVSTKASVPSLPTAAEDDMAVGAEASAGHDAPNWSRTKSAVILLGATLLYAVIAEILVNTVDVVLENYDIDEKFLGFTLFALVPNTTEFLNAISFAMNGNIALSMEIGSAYALQVTLLQIPALVFFSAFYGSSLSSAQLPTHTFSMIFPQWDLVTVILCVFLLSYIYGEGKSNYFKGTILLLSYLTVTMGFYFSSFAKEEFEDARVIAAASKGAGIYATHI